MKEKFNPSNHRICLDTPQRLVFPNSWVTHIPFAMYLMSALKPTILVELGTHTGNSYCGFCQAVSTLNLKTKCFAVDTWEGDEHAGFYGSEVFEELSKYHDFKYSPFSRLMKMTFDEAKGYFSDRSISLLHIDGLHTYDAVKHDFENWKIKLSENAIVLFHDTNVREREFGVWKFWEELTGEYPHLEFLHGNGLGVICLGKPEQMGLAELFDLNNLEDIRAFFSCVGEKYNFPIEEKHLHQIIQEKDRILQEKEQIIRQKDQAIQEKVHIIQERHQTAQEKDQIIQNKDQIIQEKDQIIQERDQTVQEKEEVLLEYKKNLVLLENQLSENILETKKSADNFLNEANIIREELNKYKQEVAVLRNSNSWKITRPLRKIIKQLRGD
jgi:hypothetical protein